MVEVTLYIYIILTLSISTYWKAVEWIYILIFSDLRSHIIKFSLFGLYDHIGDLNKEIIYNRNCILFFVHVIYPFL